jgi:hypothetical protein
VDIGYVEEYDQESLLSTSSTVVVTATAYVLGAQTHGTLTSAIAILCVAHVQ